MTIEERNTTFDQLTADQRGLIWDSISRATLAGIVKATTDLYPNRISFRSFCKEHIVSELIDAGVNLPLTPLPVEPSLFTKLTTMFRPFLTPRLSSKILFLICWRFPSHSNYAKSRMIRMETSLQSVEPLFAAYLRQ